jgi:uncharacterized protein (TIRG00374 family)
VAALALTGIAIYIVLPSLRAVFTSGPRLSTLAPWWLAGTVLAEVVSFACSFSLQQLLLGTKDRFAVVSAGLAGNAVTNVLPAGDAAGAALQYRMLSSAGLKPDTAAGGMAASSLLGVGGLLALPLLALPALLGGSAVSPGLVHSAEVGVAAFVLFVAGGILFFTTDSPVERVGGALQWAWNHFPRQRHPVTDLSERILRERDAIRSSLGRRSWSAALLVGGRLGFDYLALLAALRATGARPNPSLVLLAYAAAGIVALFPITPGGLGLVEASLSGMLVLAGVRLGDALLATFAYRLASYWLPVLAGGIAYLVFRKHEEAGRGVGTATAAGKG